MTEEDESNPAPTDTAAERMSIPSSERSSPRLRVGPRLDSVLDDGPIPRWVNTYVAAIVDAHANLIIGISKTDQRAIGYRIKHSCRIKTERKLLVLVFERYCESLGIVPNVSSPENTTYDHYHIVIRTRADLATFLDAIRPYCLVRQEAIATLADGILPALDRGDHTDRNGFLELMEDVDRFRRLAGRANRTRYDRAYFEAEWTEEST